MCVCVYDIPDWILREEEDILTFVGVGGIGYGDGRSTFIYTHRLDFEALNSFQATRCHDDDLWNR